MKSLIPILAATVFLVSLTTRSSYSQEEKKGPPLTYMDKNENLDYLDENYRILMGSGKFDSLMQQLGNAYNWQPAYPLSYRDSLAAVLAMKHGGFNRVSRYEEHTVFFPIERVGYYLYTTLKESENLREMLHLKTWYDVYRYFADPYQYSELKSAKLEQLRDRYNERWQDASIYHEMDDSALLSRAFKKGAEERLASFSNQRKAKQGKNEEDQ